MLATWTTVAPARTRSLKRPRGLWKGRNLSSAPSAPSESLLFSRARALFHRADAEKARVFHERSDSDGPDRDNDEAFLDEYDDDESSVSAASSKKRRLSGPPAPDSSPSSIEDEARSQSARSYYYLDSRPPLQPPASTDCSRNAQGSEYKRGRSTVMYPTGSKPHDPAFAQDRADWECLKERAARAYELYENDNVAEALPLLRLVMAECHRFMLRYPDPSVLFAVGDISPGLLGSSPPVLTPSEDRSEREWESNAGSEDYWSRPSTSPSRNVVRPSTKNTDPPTAFHSILGTTLFILGNIFSQDPSLAVDREPDTPSTYWLAALDVFETGENLPSCTSRLSIAEDWRMAIAWGRTLVCLADDRISRSAKAEKARAEVDVPGPPPGLSSLPPYTYDPTMTEEPKWPVNSPFYMIAQRRPPVTRRMSLASASANDIMTLAMDQFSRGIFHMPHVQSHHPHHRHAQSYPYNHISPQRPASPSRHSSRSPHPHSDHSPPSTFSRPKELFTIASEVLGLSERLSAPSERHFWASWADSVFNQMKMESTSTSTDAWRGQIMMARGRCWLVMGSAWADELEGRLERGEPGALGGERAEEAREGLGVAIEFFERARGAECADEGELQPLLAEALLTLANLTIDENKREELYSRAQAEGGEEIVVELDRARALEGGDVYMADAS